MNKQVTVEAWGINTDTPIFMWHSREGTSLEVLLSEFRIKLSVTL